MPRFFKNTEPSRSKRSFLGLASVLFVVVLLSVGAGTIALARSGAIAPITLIARGIRLIEQQYVERVSSMELAHGAIKGMLEVLDPHSEFFTPREYQSFQEDAQGSFVGIGVEVEVVDGWLNVLTVFPESPAQRAGLKAGDRFLSIDSVPARDMRLGDAIRKIRGEPGSIVRFSVRRKNVARDLSIDVIRGRVAIDPVSARWLDKHILYIGLRSFQQGSASQVRDKISALLRPRSIRKSFQGLVLDLRNNGGGLLSEAIALADAFLARGVIVQIRGRDGKLLNEQSARRRRTYTDWPVVVLINERSASAAEIVAAALSDHQRALLVGDRTFGKGSVQQLLELEDGSALKLTTARYFSPSGRSIQARGVDPDVYLPSEPLSANSGGKKVRESNLPRHLSGAGDPEQASASLASRSADPELVSLARRQEVIQGDLQANYAYQLIKRRHQRPDLAPVLQK